MKFTGDSKKREINRVPIGIGILRGRAPVSAYQIYDITYADGTSEVARGSSLRTQPTSGHLNMPKKQMEAAMDLRCDLGGPMHAAAILLESISNACWDLDAPKPKRKKRRSR